MEQIKRKQFLKTYLSNHDIKTTAAALKENFTEQRLSPTHN
jgi:hypothetical protein